MILNKITEKDVRSLCDKVIFQRGSDYFCNNRVKNISINNGVLLATVQGNDIYEVEIIEPANATSVKDLELSCTCPYGNLCKHIIAVLLYISKTKKTSLKSSEEVNFDFLDKKHLIEIIESLLKENPKILNKIKKLSNEKSCNEKYISKKLGFLFSTYVDYKSMNQLIRELNEIRRQVLFLILNNMKKEAQVILEKIVLTILNPKNYVDDSSGKLGKFLDKILQILKELLNTKVQKIEILDKFFTVFIKDNGGYSDQLEYFFIEIYEKNLTVLEDYFLNKLTILGNNKIKDKRNFLYHCVSTLLHIYEETHEYEKYISMCKRRLSEDDDMHLVEKLMELKRYEEAYSVCDDLIKKRTASPFIENVMGELRNILRKG